MGEIVRILKRSSLRQEPPCPYVAQCGGCPWQHVRYESQLGAKQKSVEDALRRIGKLKGFELKPIIASPSTYNYRRRIRLQRDGSKRLGFFTAFSHHLIEIDTCLIAADKLNGLIEQLRRWSEESSIWRLSLAINRPKSSSSGNQQADLTRATVRSADACWKKIS